MDTEVTPLELVDLSTIPMMDDDDLNHWICAICYPGYVVGRIVRMACGNLAEDVPEGSVSTPGPWCSFCETVKFCPKCGDRLTH